MDAKSLVVVNGKRQHESTYSETYSPTVSQTMLRLHLTVAAKRYYLVLQTDFPNAYLNNDLRDFVLIIIPGDIQTPATSPFCEKHTPAQNKVAEDSTIKSPPASAPSGWYNAQMNRPSSDI